MAGEVAMPSTGIGYSSLSEGGRGKIREYTQLLPLLEQLVQLVERRGRNDVVDGTDDTEGNCVLNSRLLLMITSIRQ